MLLLNKSTQFALMAGLLASSASVFGKLSGVDYSQAKWIIRILCFVMMILCNLTMWTFFAKALQNSKSSFGPTIISSATNYLLSAAAGYLLFEEATSLMWWTGTILVFYGLILIIQETNLPKLKYFRTKKD